MLFSFTPSQYSFIRDMKIMEVKGQKTWVVLARHRTFSCKPERDGIIRVDDFKQACIMQSDGNVGSKGQSKMHDYCLV